MAVVCLVLCTPTQHANYREATDAYRLALHVPAREEHGLRGRWSSYACCFRLVSYDTCLWYVARDLTVLHFAPEWLVRFVQERHRSTRTDHGKTMVSFPVLFQWGREFES